MGIDIDDIGMALAGPVGLGFGVAGGGLTGETKPGEVSQLPKMTGQQQQLLDELILKLSGTIGHTPTGGTPYGGQIAAGQSPLQSQGFDIVSQLLGGGGAFEAAQGAAMEQLQPQSMDELMQYFRGSVADPAMKTFEEDILPMINEKFIGANAGRSGAARRAVAGAGADLASNLSAQLGDLVFRSREAGKQRQAQAIPLLLESSLAPARTALDAGAQQRGIDQAGLSAAYQDFLRQAPENSPILNLFPTALGAQPFDTMVGADTYEPGFLDYATGAFSAAAPIIGGIMGGPPGAMAGRTAGQIANTNYRPQGQRYGTQDIYNSGGGSNFDPFAYNPYPSPTPTSYI